MSSVQYTIRSIPPKLDASLRQRSRATGKSLNEVVVETLAKGAGLTSASGETFHDLDWLIGQKSLDGPKLDQDMAWLDSLPKEL